jgi:hypothetical protein
MTNDVLTVQQRTIRGTDTNSLLRMYDRGKEILQHSQLQQERVKADKAIQRIAQELAKRNVSL